MRMKCDVIKDLMPSYIDNLLSEDGQCLVEEHLAECETCKAYYETLKGDDDIFEAAAEELHVDEIQPLKKIKKKMNRKTLIVSLISVLCAAVVGYGVYFALFHMNSYVPYEDSGIRVTEDGKMYIEGNFNETVGYNYADRRLRFFFVKGSFVTNHTERTEDKKQHMYADFLNDPASDASDENGNYTQTEPVEEVYYPSEEYAEKLLDRDFMVSMTEKEEDAFIKDMIASSVLIWKRPEVMDKKGMLNVRFTATVESLIDDPNLEGGAPRYVVARTFQSPPILFDAGTKLGKTLSDGETYTFIMEPVMAEEPEQSYGLDTLISLYDLRLQSVSVPQENLQGLDAVDVQYEPF